MVPLVGIFFNFNSNINQHTLTVHLSTRTLDIMCISFRTQSPASSPAELLRFSTTKYTTNYLSAISCVCNSLSHIHTTSSILFTNIHLQPHLQVGKINYGNSHGKQPKNYSTIVRTPREHSKRDIEMCVAYYRPFLQSCNPTPISSIAFNTSEYVNEDEKTRENSQ